ncbi:hypothetical protein POTOM_016578 [Populus tomentosa]|uniref:Uncharacterized protein n=1 Tax=Populus tomentosa TaxID=118781 RepID=A0A8X7ZXC4_POPTO|nr:hypothetical protein POTOM_016578 [Populus tomentosa]
MITQGKNGWSEDLEEVMKTKDSEQYMRLGHLAFKANKILAICGPLVTGTAASGSAFVGHGSWAVIVAVTEGFYTLWKDQLNLQFKKGKKEKREEGELFEVNIALKLVAA